MSWTLTLASSPFEPYHITGSEGRRHASRTCLAAAASIQSSLCNPPKPSRLATVAGHRALHPEGPNSAGWVSVGSQAAQAAFVAPAGRSQARLQPPAPTRQPRAHPHGEPPYAPPL